MVLKELGVRGTDAVFYHSTKRDRIVFVDEVPPGLICPVCRDVFQEPRIAPCGHSLCDACVQKVNRQTGKCYSCSAKASGTNPSHSQSHPNNTRLEKKAAFFTRTRAISSPHHQTSCTV